MTEGLGGRGEKLAAPFFRSLKQPHERAWFPDASFEAVGGLWQETGVYWMYHLTEEERARTVRSRRIREQAVHQCSEAAQDGDDGIRDDRDQEG